MNSYNASLTNPVLQANSAYQYNVNPTTRLTIEQLQNQLNQYQTPQNVNQNLQQSNPYEEYITTLSSCSELVKQKITQDRTYQQADNECEMLIKQLWYSKIIPEVLSYSQGRIAFEKLCNITKQLKQDYSQEEIAMTQNMQTLMNDPVVLARLQELQNGKSEIKQSPSNTKNEKDGN